MAILPTMRRTTFAAVLLAVPIAACSSSGGPSRSTPPSNTVPPSSAAPARVKVAGSMSLTDPSGYDSAGSLYKGAKCVGQGGYNDIAAGADVVVSDDAGKTLAITHLGVGHLDGSYFCLFRFHASVPAGLGFYGVTVTHRGTIKEAEGTLGHVALSLG